MPPHPSACGPHVPAGKLAHVLAMHVEMTAPSGANDWSPHLLKPPPPQYSPPEHVPQWMTFPQPSALSPHVYPSDVHVPGVHCTPPPSLKVRCGPSPSDPSDNPPVLDPEPPHETPTMTVTPAMANEQATRAASRRRMVSP
jgi:hypothetical protein